MEKHYEVDWFKECYPFPDESGKKLFNSKDTAKNFAYAMSKKGYQTMLITVTYNPDEENWDEY